MKVYTVINTFRLCGYSTPECWIANYANKDDALEAFRLKLNKLGQLTDGKVVYSDGKETSVEKLFNDMISQGFSWNCDDYDDNVLFLRQEEVQDSFDSDAVQ